MGTTRIAVESNNKNKLGEEEMDVIPRKCKVSFSNIFIREYALQPGDNPSVTAGVPIALGSEVLREKTVDIDKFERKRRKHRRYCKWDFQLTPQQRERR